MSERTRESDHMAPDRERRTSGGKSQAVKKKRPPEGQRTAQKGESGKRPAPSSEKRRTSAGLSSKGAVKKKPTGAGNKSRSAAKKPGTSSKNSGTSANKSKQTVRQSRMEDDSRMSSRDLERARRREERLRRVRRQKIIMAASGAVIVLSLLTLLIFFLSPARCIVSLSKGDKFARNEEYDEALSAYQEALETNENSVRAYRGIAGCLRMKGQMEEAKQILHTGWEKTEDKGILRYYNTLLINESVEELNAGNCSQATADRLNEVLLNDPENLDALALLDTCNQRLSGAGSQSSEEDGQ